MKQIFARYERTVIKSKQRKNISKLDEGSSNRHLSIKQRALIIALIVILMAMLVGWIAVFVSREFYGTVHRNYTTLAVVNMDNCPQAIEYKYILQDVPDGFEVVETSSSPLIEHTVYYNLLTNQSIDIMQWVKKATIKITIPNKTILRKLKLMVTLDCVLISVIVNIIHL